MGKLQPKLRFPQFKDEWRNKTVEDLCSMQAGKFISASEIKEKFENDTFPCYGGNGLRGFVRSFNYDGNYSLIGRQGALCGNVTLAKNKFYATEHAIVVKVNDNIDTIWMYYLLNILNLNQYATGQAQPGLSVQNIKRVEVVVSESKSEQTKIATFLSAVDEKLNLLKEKKAALEEYKKGMMQKIFSQEIRFKDENGNDFRDWKEKSLGEVGEIITGKTPSTKDASLWGGDIQFITPTDINENKYQFYSARTIQSNSKLKLLPPKSLLYTCIASIGKMSLSVNPCITNQQINSIIPNKEIDNEFLYYAVLNISEFIKSTPSSSTLPIINKTEFSKFKIYLPCHNEQSKIAFFLSAIDEKIALILKQIEETSEYKKGLLKQMFC